MADDEHHDELDILSTTSADMFYASKPPLDSPVPTQNGPRRSLRPRQSLPTNAFSAGFKSRKRTISTSALEHDTQTSTAKKIKLDEKKAQTGALNKKREARDEARKRWLHCHRDVVEPLLPPNSTFFNQLQKEMEREYREGVSFQPRHVLDEQPKLIKAGQMKDYQLEGLSFLVAMFKNGMNCILGDEMGLGKTLQTLSLFAYIKENIPGPHDPHLVICPLSVLSSWEAEAARWTPSLRVIRFHGPSNERERLKHSLRGERAFDIMLTTYEAYVGEDQWFKSFRWAYCVLDEGHKIKNSETILSQKVQGIGSMHRLLLTGTPVQNNLVELWGLLHWLLPNVFTLASQSIFKDSFNIERGSYAIPFLNAAKKLISIIMLRRTKATVAGDDVPPREELTMFIPLTEAQRFWTYRLLTKMDTPDLKKIFVESPSLKSGNAAADQGGREVLANLENQTESGKFEGTQWKKLMNLLMQLRKVCDHPYLLPNAEPEPYGIGEHVVSSSSKVIAIDKILAEILPKGERVLIFSQWTGMLNLLEDFMALRSIPYARLDGSTRRPRRALDIKLFQQEVSPYKVFLVSTKAGGLGINLTKATTVIMCDSDWNPQNDLQAIARAHRIGQTKVVKVYRLICQGSVEDQMLDRIRRKLFLSVKIMGSDNPSAADSTSLGSSELMDILRKGSSALSHSENGMNLARFLDVSLADITEHSKSLETKRDAKIKKDLEEEGAGVDDEQLVLDAEEEERKLLSGVAQVQSRLFEGKMIHKAQSNAEIAQEWKNLEKRARVDRTVKVGGMTFILSSIPETLAPVATKPVKQQKKKFESEEWCIHCRDGGELVLCTYCPRVFHAKCRGLSKLELRRASVQCSQHSCAGCYRNTSDSGGMLFRCRTCPQAFCEDCLPSGDLDAVGETLPEFLLLDYGASTSAYYIRCHDCIADYSETPDANHWTEWLNDLSLAEKKLEQLYAATAQ
ncbi:P-loop containing nucleoside triphosphate hydrolase protein [Lyophyllum atratum]|nr:P-loop containing nucleoside triphosphate hydrolase protein [Lyophyllum atratum]